MPFLVPHDIERLHFLGRFLFVCLFGLKCLQESPRGGEPNRNPVLWAGERGAAGGTTQGQGGGIVGSVTFTHI